VPDFEEIDRRAQEKIDAAPAVMALEVTNRNDFPIHDMFNGVPHVFPSGQTVEISTDAAAHFFGWPGEDADRALHMAKRYGWGGRENLAWTPGTQEPIYFAMVRKVEIKEVYFDLVRRKPSDPIPADDGRDPEDLPPARVEAPTIRAGKRNRRASKPRRLRDRHEPAERVR
jgi:hypothetical protein